MEKVVAQLNESEKCLPWYYPPIDLDLRLCSPFEARDFGNKLEKISHAKCKVGHEEIVEKICSHTIQHLNFSHSTVSPTATRPSTLPAPLRRPSATATSGTWR